MRHKKWKCPKCDNDAFETDIFQATGGTVSCTQCQYTEIYKAETSALSNFFDFFVGG